MIFPEEACDMYKNKISQNSKSRKTVFTVEESNKTK